MFLLIPVELKPQIAKLMTMELTTCFYLPEGTIVLAIVLLPTTCRVLTCVQEQPTPVAENWEGGAHRVDASSIRKDCVSVAAASRIPRMFEVLHIGTSGDTR